MWAISRFRVDDAATFVPAATAAEEWFRGRPGNLSSELVQNLDDPSLWALVSHWQDVGSYRRAFNGYDAKMILMPILGQAIDEPSAFAAADDVGENLPRAR